MVWVAVKDRVLATALGESLLEKASAAMSARQLVPPLVRLSDL